MDEAEIERRREYPRVLLTAAGAHFVVDRLTDLEPVIHGINGRLARGENPGASIRRTWRVRDEVGSSAGISGWRQGPPERPAGSVTTDSACAEAALAWPSGHAPGAWIWKTSTIVETRSPGMQDPTRSGLARSRQRPAQVPLRLSTSFPRTVHGFSGRLMTPVRPFARRMFTSEAWLNRAPSNKAPGHDSLTIFVLRGKVPGLFRRDAKDHASQDRRSSLVRDRDSACAADNEPGLQNDLSWR